MPVIPRPSAHKFIQKAYREARNAGRIAKENVSSSIAYGRTDGNGNGNGNGGGGASGAAAAANNNHVNYGAVPYDHATKRRVAMALVDLCTAYIEGLWPQQNCKLPLRNFIFEILRRSRVQYPVFQVALCYLARLQPVIRSYTSQGNPIPESLACGRRVLIACLQISLKFLQDRCYSATVWSRISGLTLDDLKRNELAVMAALNWNLFVSYEAYMRSCKRLRVTVDAAFMERVTSPLTTGQRTPRSYQQSQYEQQQQQQQEQQQQQLPSQTQQDYTHSIYGSGVNIGPVMPTPEASPRATTAEAPSPDVEICTQL